jgi:tellurite resistance protein TerC
VSLSVIVVILILTTVVSLVSARGRAENAVARARRHAIEYLNRHYETDPAEREKIFSRLLIEERQIKALPGKYRARIWQQDELMNLLRRAHQAHEAYNPG